MWVLSQVVQCFISSFFIKFLKVQVIPFQDFVLFQTHLFFYRNWSEALFRLSKIIDFLFSCVVFDGRISLRIPVSRLDCSGIVDGKEIETINYLSFRLMIFFPNYLLPLLSENGQF